MSTTIVQGAFFGSGIYGSDRYGVGSTIYVPDGVEATSVVGSVNTLCSAVTTIVGNESFTAVGSLSVAASANTNVNGVEAVSFVNVVNLSTTAVVNIIGGEVLSVVGTLTVEATASIHIISVEAVISLGGVSIAVDIDVPVNGVSVSSFVGSIIIPQNKIVSAEGLSLVSSNNSVLVVTTAFNYEAIKENFDRERAVYVDSRLQRFVYVDGVPRVVYVESSISPYERAAKVGSDTRQIYINRGTTQQERIVVIEE